MNVSRFWRWHPEVSLRYLPLVKKISESGIRNPKVLEVGSGWLGISPYLGIEVVGVDIGFENRNFSLLKQQQGQATALPFPDNSFDFVIMTDVIEHLSIEKRNEAIRECLRCARAEVFIACPCGKLSEEQDRNLSEYYKKTFGKPFPFYNDHLNYGLPEKEFINDTIKKEAETLDKKVEIEVLGNTNLKLHEFLMKGWMTNNPIVDFLFRKVFLILIPVFKRMNQKPAYRYIFFVKIR